MRIFDRIALTLALTVSGGSFVANGAAYAQPTTEDAKIVAADGAANDGFGGSAISADGDRMVVGSRGDDGLGSAYIYEYDGSSWIQKAKVRDAYNDGKSGDSFGGSVSLLGDRLLVGAPLDDPPWGNQHGNWGSFHFFKYDGNSWNQVDGFIPAFDPPDSRFYRDDPQMGFRPANSAFNSRVGAPIAQSGNRAIISAPGNNQYRYNGAINQVSGAGGAWIYEYDGTTFQETAWLSINEWYPYQENFGRSVAMEGDRVAVGAVPAWWHGNTTDSGSVYVFEYDGNDWIQTAKLKAPFGEEAGQDGFGTSVALSGDRLFVGAMQHVGSYVTEEGSVYIFDYNGSTWDPVSKLQASDGADNNRFGAPLSTEGDRLLVGASFDDDPGSASGAAYLYEFDGANWNETKLEASDPADGDRFGETVFLTDTRAFAGSIGDDDRGSNSGSVYVFDLDGSAPPVSQSIIFEDFSDLSPFHLNGSANGAVNTQGDDVLRVTPAVGGQAGSAFLLDPISLVGDAAFSAAFSLQITNPGPGIYNDGDGLGADGMVFVVTQTPNAVGLVGAGIGYQGIPNSIGVEFDTWNNSPSNANFYYPDNYGDNTGNHVSINVNGNISNPIGYADVGEARLNDGQLWYAWVDYNGQTQTLEVRLSLSSERPAAPRISVVRDLASTLGDDVYIGFTSGTGGAYGNHDVVGLQFNNEYDPVIDVPGPTNNPPLANAGVDQTITCTPITGTDVTLDGSLSSDPDSDPLSYSWREGGVEIANGANATISLAPGVHTIDLVVNDGTEDSAPDQVIITVVEDVTPPVVTLNGAAELTIECSIGTYTEQDATALDECDGALTVSTAGSVDTSTPGDYTLTYTATDAAGNNAQATRLIHVVDTTPPAIALTGINPQILECSVDAYAELGATALDACAGDLTAAIVIDSSTVDASALGDYTVTYTVTDPAGNSAQVTRTVTVVDTTLPEVLAALNSVEEPKSSKSGKSSKSSKSEKSSKSSKSSKHYQVMAQATDICDVSPVVTALINQPLTASDVITKIKYKESKKENKIEIKIGNKIEVTLRGPDEAVLQGLLNDAIAQGGFPVSDGQVLKLKSKELDEGSKSEKSSKSSKSEKSSKSSKEKDPRDGHYKYEFDLDLTLEEVDGISVRMIVSAVDASGNATEPVEIELPSSIAPAAKLAVEQKVLPETFKLGNYPNPFNPSTTIAYQLPNAGEVSLIIYNVMGQQIRVLEQGFRAQGVYEVEWNGRDDNGQTVSSGLYLYRFISADVAETQRMTLLK